MKRMGVMTVMFLVVFGFVSCFGALAAVKEVTIWSWGAEPMVAIGLKENTWPLIEKEFGVKIKHELFPGMGESEFVAKIVTAMRFATGPDIIEATDKIISGLAYEGFLEPIPGWLDKSLQEKLLPSCKNIHYFWNEDGYKKPFVGVLTRCGSGQIVYWNKEMYKEVGLDRSPRTWDEVFKFGEKLTKYTPDGSIERSGFFFRTGGGVGGITDKWVPYFLSAGGGSLLTIEKGKIKANFNTPAGRKTVQFYLDGLYKYRIDAMGIPGDVGGWMKGQTATVSARRFWVPGVVKAEAPDMYAKLGAGPIPVAEEGMKSITTDGISGIAVNPRISSEKKELIWKLCDRLNEFDMVRLQTIDMVNWLPYREIQGKGPFTEELWQDAVKYSQNLAPLLEAPKFAVVQSILGEQLHLIFAKEKTIEEGLAAAAEGIKEALEDVVLKEL